MLSSKSELQKALERRKKQQSERTEGQDRETPLDKVLLKRQQTHLEVRLPDLLCSYDQRTGSIHALIHLKDHSGLVVGLVTLFQRRRH